MELVEKPKMVHIQFTLDLEGMKDQRIFEWMEILHNVLHGNKWILLHGLANVMLGP